MESYASFFLSLAENSACVCVCTFSKEVKLVPVLDDVFLVDELLIGL